MTKIFPREALNVLERDRLLKIATLEDFKKKVEAHVGVGKPGWLQGCEWMKAIVIQDIEVEISETEKLISKDKGR